MNATELKRKMIALWKETFRDSDGYIALLFDKFFDPKLCEYEISGNEIVSMAMGIPYEFGGMTGKIKGLFLCGLATKQRYRGQGKMGILLDRINKKAAESGYAFTFLIPNGERAQRFYSHHGYVDAFYRCEQNYTSLHDFRQEYSVILELQKEKVADLKKRYYDTLIGSEVQNDAPNELLLNIRKLILGSENDQCDMEVIHSDKDIDTVFEENQVEGGNIYYVANAQGMVSAVAFTRLVDRSRVEIDRLYSSDECSIYRLLDHIKSKSSEAGIRLYVDPKESEHKNLAKMYGMARILNLGEILKFQAASHGDLKYSILVKETEGGIDRYDIKGGTVKHHSIPLDSDEYDPSKTVMSLRDISSVLFRRPDTGALITEAFGMPSLGGYISLMPD